MSRKSIGIPDSDQTARQPDAALSGEDMPDDATEIEGLQTSNKTGKHSSSEKLAASRPGFGSSPGANPVDGAFGQATSEEAGLRGPRLSLAGTNQFHCEFCGRDLNTQSELSAHQVECRLAKQAAHPENG